MNYSKLKSSFFILLLMTILQFVVSLFILHHTVITILSIGAMILCIVGLIYISNQENDKKE